MLFINLTEPGEFDTQPYLSITQAEARLLQVNTPLRYMSFPIPDRSIPGSREMMAIVEALQSILSDGYNLYIHCYGGSAEQVRWLAATWSPQA